MDKLISIEEMLAVRKGLSMPLIVTNGGFELLRRGHKECLQAAKALALDGKLLVLLNSDASITTRKGIGRPFLPASVRAANLSALPYVDYVVFFGAPSPRYILGDLRPDIYVKGGDYDLDMISPATRAILSEIGTRIEFIPRNHTRSTTKVGNRLRQWGRIIPLNRWSGAMTPRCGADKLLLSRGSPI